jgi:hypothetical protein
VKQQHRSAIAVVAASVLGGTGVAVAAVHLAAPAQQDASSPEVTAPAATATTATDLARRIHDLIAGTHQMNSRLVTSRHDLARQLRELTRLRERAAAQRGTALSAGSVISPPVVVPAPPSPPPAAHTTTGASGTGRSADDPGDDTMKEHVDD